MNNTMNNIFGHKLFYTPSRERTLSYAGDRLKMSSSSMGGGRYEGARSDGHLLGHGLRNFTAAAFALPADAACVAHARVVAPATNVLASALSAVGGSVVGAAGALVGAVVGTLFLSPVTGGKVGFLVGANLVGLTIHGVADAVKLAIDCVLVPLAMLLRLLGWSVGAVASLPLLPLMVFGHYQEKADALPPGLRENQRFDGNASRAPSFAVPTYKAGQAS